MAGLDHTILFYILHSLKGRTLGKNNGETGRDLLIYNSNTLTKFANGTQISQDNLYTVFWLDGEASNISRWRNQTIGSREKKYISSQELLEEFKQLDKNCSEQAFPNKNVPNQFSFSSHAYKVLLEYMRGYSEDVNEVRISIISYLEEKAIDESTIDFVGASKTHEEIARRIIETVRQKSQIKDSLTQIKIAEQLSIQVKPYSLHMLIEEGASTYTTASDISKAWPLPLIKQGLADEEGTRIKIWKNFLDIFGEEYSGFLRVLAPRKTVGYWFALPVRDSQIADVLDGSFLKKSYSENYCSPLYLDSDCSLFIVNLGITADFQTEENIDLLLKSFSHKLLLFAEKGTFFKSIYTYQFAASNESHLLRLGFKKRENPTVFVLDTSSLTEGAWPEELRQKYSDHFTIVPTEALEKLLDEAGDNASSEATLSESPSESGSGENSSTIITKEIPPKKIQIAFAKAKSSARKIILSKKRKLLIGLGCILVSLLLIISAGHRPSPPETGTEPPTPSPPEEMGPSGGIEADTDNCYSFTLKASGTTTVRDFNVACEAVKKRLDVLCGSEEYVFEETTNSINLELPQNVFFSNNPVDVVEAFISRPVEIYFYNLGGFPDDHLLLERKNIASLELCNGTIEGLHEVGESSDYIKLVLSDEYAQKLAEEAAAWCGAAPMTDVDENGNTEVLTGPFIRLAHDVTEDYYYTPSMVMQDDGKTIYIEALPGCAELMHYVYSQDPIPVSYNCEFGYEVHYENTESALFPGQFQVNEAEMLGYTVEIAFSHLYSDNATSSDWIGSELGLKTRLDIISQPYAYGRLVSSNSTFAVVNIDSDYMGGPIINLITSNDYDLTFVCNGLIIDCDSTVQTEIIENKDGTVAFKMSVPDTSWYDDVTLEEFENCFVPGAKVNLCIKGIPLLSTTIDETFSEEELIFGSLYCNDHELLTSQNCWVLNLIDEVLFGEEDVYFYAVEHDFNLDRENIPLEEGSFGYHYNEDKQKIIENLSDIIGKPNFYVSDTAPGDFQIALHLYVDELLPQLAVETIAAIYDASGFEESCYTQLYIFLIDEANEDLERARFLFKKNIYPYSDLADVSCQYMFSGGRLEKYRETFDTLVASSEFFSRYPAQSKNN